MTMDELNAIYNNMSVYGDTYTTPTTTIPKDPNAGQPPILEPLIPAFPMQYINQGGDNDGGITTLAPDYGYDSVFDNTNITPKDQLQTNFEYDIGEGTIPQEDIDNNKTSGIAGLLELLQKISPMANIMKLGKTGIETAQKYFADKKETERLETLAQIEQEKIKADKADKIYKEKLEADAITMAANTKNPDGSTAAYNYAGRDNKQGTHTSTKTKEEAATSRESGRGNYNSSSTKGTDTSASKSSKSSSSKGTNQGYSQHYRDGGIVTL